MNTHETSLILFLFKVRFQFRKVSRFPKISPPFRGWVVSRSAEAKCFGSRKVKHWPYTRDSNWVKQRSWRLKWWNIYRVGLSGNHTMFFFFLFCFVLVVDSFFLEIWVGETRFCRVLDRTGRSHRWMHQSINLFPAWQGICGSSRVVQAYVENSMG